jgi:methylglutaconyl-CoA hydratase
MAYRHLLLRRDGPVERLTLNRPEVRNAFNATLIAELTDWAQHAGRDDTVRVVVIEGAGKAFCAGADVAWMAETVTYSAAENLQDAEAAAAMFGAIDRLPLPVVGRIHGAAIGGGAGLAAVCDVVVADEQTMFGFTEVRIGILPAVISPFVLAKIGRSAARELFLTGSRFTAARAREIGLVHAVVRGEELDAAADGYVREFLSGGREALAAAKRLVARVWGLPIEASQPITTAAIAERRVSDEGQEGLRAFLEKRKPGWSAS